jgi:hypothetical protein
VSAGASPWYSVGEVRALRPIAILALLATAPAASADVEGSLGLGYGWLTRRGDRAGTVRSDGGVALGLRVEGRVAEQVGLGLSFGWGLADWDRAGQYIAAGNRAGSWTTDQFAKVERWGTRTDVRQDTRGLRFLGMVFADMFLFMTYAAVPACYLGSVGGATSWLEVDGTAAFHLAPAQAPYDAWLEAGLGAATLPSRLDWRSAWGPVAGFGMRYGALRVGARVLWSPAGLNEAPFGGSVVAGALTLGLAR